MKTKHHQRIHPINYAILARCPPEHPAVRALQVQAESRDVCVGRELVWRDRPDTSIEQRWFSGTRLKDQLFSAFAYEFLSYDLVLDGWLEMPPQPTDWEASHLEKDDPLMRALLDECEEAANDDANTDVLPLIAKAREFLDVYKEAILLRFKECEIPWPVDSRDHN